MPLSKDTVPATLRKKRNQFLKLWEKRDALEAMGEDSSDVQAKIFRVLEECDRLEARARRARFPFSEFDPSKDRPSVSSCFHDLENSDQRIRDEAFEELFRTCSRKRIFDFAKEHYGLTPSQCIFLWFRKGTRQGQKVPIVEMVAGYNHFAAFSRTLSGARFIRKKRMWSAIYDDRTREQLRDHLFNMYGLIVDVNNRFLFSGNSKTREESKQPTLLMAPPVPPKEKTFREILCGQIKAILQRRGTPNENTDGVIR